MHRTRSPSGHGPTGQSTVLRLYSIARTVLDWHIKVRGEANRYVHTPAKGLVDPSAQEYKGLRMLTLIHNSIFTGAPTPPNAASPPLPDGAPAN